MKTLNLILFCFLLSSIQLKAQSQDLVDNTWYLEKIVINDIEFLHQIMKKSIKLL